ncbi:MAG: hypothetical protein ACOCUV_04030 [bacterium]
MCKYKKYKYFFLVTLLIFIYGNYGYTNNVSDSVASKNRNRKTGGIDELLLENAKTIDTNSIQYKNQQFYGKYTACRKRQLTKMLMTKLNTTSSYLDVFYKKYPHTCGRVCNVLLFISPQCEIIGFKIGIWDFLNNCGADDDLKLIKIKELEYKRAFTNWLNSITVKDSLINIGVDTLYYEVPFIIDGNQTFIK